ncbi:MAG: zinc-ribbon domain-containing protein [Bacilli bacterium]|nr:zinc-ribbon domain-containing protein [Bacilli bacterium]
MICPKCKREIDERESFCPYCGATIAKREEEKSTEEVRYCSACGFKLNPGVTFCPNCGSLVNKEKSSDKKETDIFDLKTDEKVVVHHPDLEIYIGRDKYHYYKSAFDNIETNKSATWNWCSAIFGPLWFFYRKMIVPGFIYLIINIGLLALNAILENLVVESITLALFIGLHVLCGVFGNTLYLKKYQKDLKGAEGLTGDKRSTYLYHKGNTNAGYVFIPIIIWIVANSILEVFFPTNIVFETIFHNIFKFFK